MAKQKKYRFHREIYIPSILFYTVLLRNDMYEKDKIYFIETTRHRNFYSTNEENHKNYYRIEGKKHQKNKNKKLFLFQNLFLFLRN